MTKKMQSAAFVLAFVATGASADHVYKGLADGHPDLGEPHARADSFTNLAARNAGLDGFDMHQGLSQGNPDLSQPPGATGAHGVRPAASRSIDLHHGFSGNPDLSPPPAD
jgi:hypothetical protein